MNIFSLALIVLVGILCFVLFFHLSNLILDYYGRVNKKDMHLKTSIRVIIFIAPAL